MEQQGCQTNQTNSSGNLAKKILSMLGFVIFCIVFYHLFFTNTLSQEGKKKQAFELANAFGITELNDIGLNVYWQTENDEPIYTVGFNGGTQIVQIKYIVNSDIATSLGDVAITYSAEVKTEFHRNGQPSGELMSSEIITATGVTLSVSEFQNLIYTFEVFS